MIYFVHKPVKGMYFINYLIMYKVKFIVIFLYFTGIHCKWSDYCDICLNHVLCKYNKKGPGDTCTNYDKKAVLSYKDIEAIVSKVNERRNYIAAGLARNTALPQAANMKKISWSDNLATFAQRWVDQCDSNVKPDKKDDCRDLADMAVGQNIATISGWSSRLNIKSFIDMWFMESMDYKGSVTYYNRSLNSNTDSFTQLIWANTFAIGCGKAKFNISNGSTPLERLVCNFAPRGNLDAKPVFAIGFPATQCSEESQPDDIYPNLCSSILNDTYSTIRPASSAKSLLRILNVFNDTDLLEIDPIKMDRKFQTPKANYKKDHQSNQKSRHIYISTNVDALPDPNLNNSWNLFHVSTSAEHVNHQRERLHSRLYHGLDFTDVNFHTRFFTTINDYKTNENLRCTRKLAQNILSTNNDCLSVKCTRGQKKIQYLDPCIQYFYTGNPLSLSNCEKKDQCSCLQLKTTCTPTQCTCIASCQCANDNKKNYSRTLTTISPRKFRKHSYLVNNYGNAPDFQYHDLFPNVNNRGGESYRTNLINNQVQYSKTETSFFNSNGYHDYQSSDPIINYNRHNIKELITESRENKRPVTYHDYLHKNIYDSNRKRRKSNDDNMSFKPFWQMEEITKKTVELKSLRYTTLAKIKMKKMRLNTETTKKSKVTEPITISNYNKTKQVAKEKFLSFEELMNLRKNAGNVIYSGRRRHKPILRDGTTATAAAETYLTTPFIAATVSYPRIKHCTRLLTCTWTAPTIPGGEGIILPNRGSRTRPGYVDGCTRTSTCTRDFIERNKMPKKEEGSGETIEDEDYCEKRSLNVRRRKSQDDEDHTVKSNYNIERISESPMLTNTKSYDVNKHYKYTEDKTEEGCVCASYSKKKREINSDSITNKKSYPKKTYYGVLYYEVLEQMLNSWRNKEKVQVNKCLCNSSCNMSVLTKSVMLFIIITTLLKFIYI